MFLKLLINLFLLSIFLNSNEINLLSLSKETRSIKKDFYILEFLKQKDIKEEEVIKALGMAKEVRNKLFFAYAKALKHDETSAVSQCMQSNISFLINSYDDCIIAGLSIKKASTLSLFNLDLIILKTKKKYKKFTSVLKIINSPLPFSRLMSSNIDVFYKVYLGVSDEFLINKLNYRIPTRILNKIKNDPRFSSLLQKIISMKKMFLAQKSFFTLKNEDYSFDTSFYLSLNLLQHNKKDEAFTSLSSLYSNNLSSINKNKILYFKYFIKKDKLFLEDIIKNKLNDIYTLFSYELLDRKRDKEFKKTYLTPLNADIDKELHKDLKKYSLNKQVIFLSLIKELSNFDKNLIKNEYKLGLAQIKMEDFDKIYAENSILVNEDINFSIIFSVKNSLKYLDDYLKSLDEDKVQNLLFSLFSYFQSIKEEEFFALKSSFFLQIELYKTPYIKESMKKVLVNYIMYNKLLLKKEIKIQELIKEGQKTKKSKVLKSK